STASSVLARLAAAVDRKPLSPNSSNILHPATPSSTAAAGSPAMSSKSTDSMPVMTASPTPNPRSASSARVSASILRPSSKRPSMDSAIARYMRRQSLGRTLRLEGHADDARVDLAAQLANAIARGRSPLGDGLGPPERLVALASPEQGIDKVGLEWEVELGRGDERGGPPEQARG